MEALHRGFRGRSRKVLYKVRDEPTHIYSRVHPSRQWVGAGGYFRATKLGEHIVKLVFNVEAAGYIT